MGKKLDAQIKQQTRFYRKRIADRYKGPWDCPACFKPKALTLRKHDSHDGVVTWVAICNSCNLFKKFDLPINLTEIDAHSKIMDLVRSNE